jgi:hypothetical protein
MSGSQAEIGQRRCPFRHVSPQGAAGSSPKHPEEEKEMARRRIFTRGVALAAAVAAFAVPSAASADSVRLYDHANLEGASFVPRDSEPNLRSIDCWLWWCTNWNDRASSLHVPAYTCVRLYEHIHYGGLSREYCAYNYAPNGTSRNFNLDGFWNDRTSSSATYGRIIQQ